MKINSLKIVLPSRIFGLFVLFVLFIASSCLNSTEVEQCDEGISIQLTATEKSTEIFTTSTHTPEIIPEESSDEDEEVSSSDCDNSDMVVYYQWLSDTIIGRYMFPGYDSPRNNYMCTGAVDSRDNIEFFNAVDFPSNVENIEELSKYLPADITDIVGIHYSNSYQYVIYQTVNATGQKHQYELWGIDLSTGERSLILGESNAYNRYIYPDTINWLDREHIYIDMPYADFEDIFIDISNGSYEIIYKECKLNPYLRVLFSPEANNVLLLFPEITQEGTLSSDYYSVYAMTKETFLDNYNYCKTQQVEELQQGREALLSGARQLPFHVNLYDVLDFYPPIQWAENDNEVYVLDRNEDSETYGDIIRFDLINFISEVVLPFESYQDLIIEKDYPLWWRISAGGSKIFVESDSKEVFVLSTSE